MIRLPISSLCIVGPLKAFQKLWIKYNETVLMHLVKVYAILLCMHTIDLIVGLHT